MILHKPFHITSRLMAGIKIGDAILSMEVYGAEEGRLKYRAIIDIQDTPGPHDGGWMDDSLKSGTGNGTLQNGFSSFLSYLGAAAESYRYR